MSFHSSLIITGEIKSQNNLSASIEFGISGVHILTPLLTCNNATIATINDIDELSEADIIHNTRILAIEEKTNNIIGSAGLTEFTSEVLMNDKRITGLGSPTKLSDAATKSYADLVGGASVTLKNASGVADHSLISTSTPPNFTLKSIKAGSGGIAVTSTSELVTVSNTTTITCPTGISLVAAASYAPAFQLNGLLAGTGIAIAAPSGGVIQISTSHNDYGGIYFDKSTTQQTITSTPSHISPGPGVYKSQPMLNMSMSDQVKGIVRFQKNGIYFLSYHGCVKASTTMTEVRFGISINDAAVFVGTRSASCRSSNSLYQFTGSFIANILANQTICIKLTGTASRTITVEELTMTVLQIGSR